MKETFSSPTCFWSYFITAIETLNTSLSIVTVTWVFLFPPHQHRHSLIPSDSMLLIPKPFILMDTTCPCGCILEFSKFSLPFLTRAWIGCWPSVLNVARAIYRIEYNLWVTVSSVAIVTALSLFPGVPQIALKSRCRAKPFPQRGQEFYFHREQNS